MLFKRISRASAETVFVVVKNVSGGTLTANYSCCWDVSAADGVRVTQPAVLTQVCYAGVADADIANNAYGLIQVYGYRSNAYITYSSVSIVAGDALGTGVAISWGLERLGDGATGDAGSFAFAAAAVASSSAVAVYTNSAVFLRAM